MSCLTELRFRTSRRVPAMELWILTLSRHHIWLHRDNHFDSHNQIYEELGWDEIFSIQCAYSFVNAIKEDFCMQGAFHCANTFHIKLRFRTSRRVPAMELWILTLSRQHIWLPAGGVLVWDFCSLVWLTFVFIPVNPLGISSRFE
jgi:hypothetical protein